MTSAQQAAMEPRTLPTKQIVVILDRKRNCLDDFVELLLNSKMRRSGVSVLGFADRSQVRQIIGILKGAEETLPQ